MGISDISGCRVP